jgi:hypothetical protein
MCVVTSPVSIFTYAGFLMGWSREKDLNVEVK